MVGRRSCYGSASPEAVQPGHITSILSREKQNPEPLGPAAVNRHHRVRRGIPGTAGVWFQDLGSRIDHLANLADVAQGSADTCALVDETAQQEFA
jgi:hypothetical protein